MKINVLIQPTNVRHIEIITCKEGHRLSMTALLMIQNLYFLTCCSCDVADLVVEAVHLEPSWKGQIGDHLDRTLRFPFVNQIIRRPSICNRKNTVGFRSSINARVERTIIHCITYLGSFIKRKVVFYGAPNPLQKTRHDVLVGILG